MGTLAPCARSRLLRTPIQTYIILYIHAASQHSRARLATSPALGSASICQFPVSNKMDGWRMEIMVETRPHTLKPSVRCARVRAMEKERSYKPEKRKREKERRKGQPLHSVCDHPYTERPAAPALFRASISYHPLSRLLCFKIQIRRGKEIAWSSLERFFL